MGICGGSKGIKWCLVSTEGYVSVLYYIDGLIKY